MNEALAALAWLLQVLPGMTIPGAGGQVPARPDQQILPSQPVPVSPGGDVVVARRVIIAGTLGELFVYSPTAGAGNLILSISATVGGGIDNPAYGNHFVFGLGVYDNAGGFFSQYGAGFATFGTGSLAAGWTANTSIQNDSSGDLFLSANAHIFANGVQIA